jgi:hypothetical protein
LVILVTVSSNGGKYTGLCILLFGSYTSAPLLIAWLSGNTPGKSSALPALRSIYTKAESHAEPGKRSLVIGVNGCGNLAGVIGAQLYKKRYSPRFLVPFYVTLGFVIFSMVGFLSYRFVLRAVNRDKARKVRGWTDEQIENERTSSERYADKKYIFVYGL